MDSNHVAYLDAMGIEVWVPRVGKPPGESDVGGSIYVPADSPDGDILCVVETGEQARLPLAVDIGRAMRCMPVWSWPADAHASDVACMSLDEVVRDRLATQILVFGATLCAHLFGETPPDYIGAARVHVVPSLQDLGSDRGAKRILWNLMREQGINKP